MSTTKSPHRIVAIEDNPADTMLLRLALDEQKEPYVLQVLSDGESALEYIRHQCHGPEPCLIILDLKLPQYDGVTILRAIRAQPELAHIRVMVLTSMASPAEREQVIALGIESYRLKPNDWAQTLQLAEELIAICNRPMVPLAATAL